VIKNWKRKLIRVTSLNAAISVNGIGTFQHIGSLVLELYTKFIFGVNISHNL